MLQHRVRKKGDLILEQTTRLYHCHKLHKNVHIFEDYDNINGVRTLVRCSCPNYTDTASDGHSCNGLNDYGIPCGYAKYQGNQ